MRKIFILILCCTSFSMFAQDSLQSTIILIGDAGQLTADGLHPVVSAVRKHMPLDKKTTVVYLGDNLYKTGLPDEAMPTYAIAKAPLDSQIVIAKGRGAKVFFIPGNHDWANGTAIGYESILRVQSYIDILGDKNVRHLPRNGCPGPVEVAISEDVQLVIMDSQWWLHEDDKPGIESDCENKTKAEVLTALDDILSHNDKKLVILAVHHPFKSYGPHGGYFTLKQHIFPFTDAFPKAYIPLPIIGSAYPLTRAVFGTIQDLKHPLYQNMISRVTNVVNKHQNVIFVSGHEHTLQVIQDSNYNYIVSGSGSKSNRVSNGPNTLYSTSKNGFVTLEISKNKNVRATAYTIEDTTFSQEFSENILNFTTIDPPESKDTLRQVEYSFKDSVVISASDQYKSQSGFRRTVLGNNYRKEWSEPVKMKEFNISKEKGGFKIVSLGGGKQTKSLKLIDNKGREWALRSIDKDPETAIPEGFRGTFAADIVQDAISASHPYAPLSVPVLAKAAGVLQATPEIFFVPDDPAFGIYRKIFANTVVMLEQRDPTPDNSDTKSTFTVINKIIDDNDHHILQQEVLKARFLDMLIGDFDRHADQWKWGLKDTGKGKLYYPIPRDRDQAFFNSDGLLIKAVSYFSIPYLYGFKKGFHNIEKFNMVAKDFDRKFLNEMDEEDWKAALTKFTADITDSVIEKAIHQLPPEIYAINGPLFIANLKSRRDDIYKQGMKYYKFISEEVVIEGSNKNEFFHVQNADGNVKLSVYKKKDEADSVALMYQRVFIPGQTREIILYGLNGEDKFLVDDDVDAKMIIRVIGGKGDDTFNLGGRTKKYLYDLITERNSLVRLNRTKNLMSRDIKVLDYSNDQFQYNRNIFPILNLGFNAEDKLLLGFSIVRTTHGFRKEPFKTNQKFSTLFAPVRQAFQVNYKGEFTQAIFKQDLVLKADYVSPTLNNFFGAGNESFFDKSKPLEFYRVRYKYIEVDALIRKRIGKVASFSFGPTFYHYFSDLEDNKDRIINNSSQFDTANIFKDRDYLGAKVNLNVTYIDNPLFPKRGITWDNNLTLSRGMNDLASNLYKASSDMTIYANVTGNSKVTAVLRFGGGKIFSSDPEYFQLLTLGANNFNRGFRKNRFAGDGLLYSGAELRYRLFKSKSYVLPGEVGVIGYYDIGRVWLKNESSDKWHDSFGGGFYFAPFNLILVSATLGVSPEEQLFNFTIGAKFNLTF